MQKWNEQFKTDQKVILKTIVYDVLFLKRIGYGTKNRAQSYRTCGYKPAFKFVDIVADANLDSPEQAAEAANVAAIEMFHELLPDQVEEETQCK